MENILQTPMANVFYLYQNVCADKFIVVWLIQWHMNASKHFIILS